MSTSFGRRPQTERPLGDRTEITGSADLAGLGGAALACSVLALLASLGIAAASEETAVGAPFAITSEERLLLRVEPLVVQDGNTRSLGGKRLEVPRGAAGRLEMEIGWPEPGTSSQLALEVMGQPGEADAPDVFSVAASLASPRRAPVRATREFSLAEGSLGLFEIMEQGDRRLVLSFRAERITRPVAVSPTRAGAVVLFRLEVERVQADRTVPLETNRLTTFVGHGVEYSFRRGTGATLESVRLVLTPLSVVDELAEIQVEVSGSLPGESGPLVLARKERLITSRGAASSFVVVAGEPPAGYRFLLTPEF